MILISSTLCVYNAATVQFELNVTTATAFPPERPAVVVGARESGPWVTGSVTVNRQRLYN